MRDFVLDIALPTIAYFVSVAFFISVVIFAAAIAVEVVSDPVEVAWSDLQ